MEARLTMNKQIAGLAVPIFCLQFFGSAVSAAESSPGAFPPLQSPPPQAARMSADQLSKLKSDLAGARDRANSHVKTKQPVPKRESPRR